MIVISNPDAIAEPVRSIAIHGNNKNTIEPEMTEVIEAICAKTNGTKDFLAESKVIQADGREILVAGIFDNFLRTCVTINHGCDSNDDCARFF